MEITVPALAAKPEPLAAGQQQPRPLDAPGSGGAQRGLSAEPRPPVVSGGSFQTRRAARICKERALGQH